jgi:hypothetical protein
MRLRALAVLGVVGLPATAAAIDAPLGTSALLPTVAAGILLALALAVRRLGLSLLVAAALAALATHQAAAGALAVRRAADPELWPLHDLTVAAAPADAIGPARLRGVPHRQWILDEYRVGSGTRPDQNAPATAVLVPILGSERPVVSADAPIVVARVTDPERLGAGVVELRGELSPLPPGLLEALVDAASTDAGASPPVGLLLDTARTPSRGSAWTQVGISVVASLIALALAWTALPGPRVLARAPIG